MSWLDIIKGILGAIVGALKPKPGKDVQPLGDGAEPAQPATIERPEAKVIPIGRDVPRL